MGCVVDVFRVSIIKRGHVGKRPMAFVTSYFAVFGGEWGRNVASFPMACGYYSEKMRRHFKGVTPLVSKDTAV